MNNHQDILQNQIQNILFKMASMMDTAKESGALGSKIIGSFGGGFMVTMVDDENKYKVKQAFMEAGAIAVYEIELIN